MHTADEEYKMVAAKPSRKSQRVRLSYGWNGRWSCSLDIARRDVQTDSTGWQQQSVARSNAWGNEPSGSINTEFIHRLCNCELLKNYAQRG